MKSKLLLLLMTLTVKRSLGITEYVKIGSDVDLTCHTNDGDQPEFCSFIRPDGLVLCQDLTTYPEKIPENCIDDRSIEHIEVGVDFCKLFLSQVNKEHLGAWQCTTISWGEENNEIISLEQVTDAKVEVLNLWGIAHLEIGIEQMFKCSLESEQNLKPLKWLLTYPSKVTETPGAPELVYDEEEEANVSSIKFTPETKHQNAVISCRSEESEESDSFQMDLFKFVEMKNSFLPSSAQEGFSMNKTYKFSAFPRPQPNNIQWIINLPTDTIILHPGNTMGHITASDIEDMATDVYKVVLQVDKVSLDMSEKEHALFIKISESKEETIPFTIDVQPKATVDVNAFNDFETSTSNVTVNDTIIGTPKVETENVSLFIIIGIIILCLILCILFYSAKCCNKKNEKKEEKVDEENPVARNGEGNDKKENAPLLSGKTEENGQVNPPPLFNEEEYLVQLCGDMSSLPSSQQVANDEEKRDLEEKLETLRRLTNAPEVKDERQVESKLKRVPTLPKNHPSHQDDHNQLREKAKQLQSLTNKIKSDEDNDKKQYNDGKDHEKEQASDEKNNEKKQTKDGQDNEKKQTNNGKVTPEKKNVSRKASIDIAKEKIIDLKANTDESKDETDAKKMKISTIEIKVDNKPVENVKTPEEEGAIKKDECLTRDWKLSPIWKKSIDGLDSGMEDSSPIGLQHVEIKLNLATSPTKKPEISYTKLNDDRDSSSEDDSVTVIPNTTDDVRPLIDEDTSTDDETTNKSKAREQLTSTLLILSKTPLKPSRTSKEGKVSTSTPKENTGLTQKPPRSPKSPADKKKSKSSSALDPREATQPTHTKTNDNQSADSTAPVALTRKDSVDAGTQTPKIRARSVDLYFGGSSSSGSDQSLNKEEISEKLIKETQQLKKEVEQLKKKLEDPSNDEVFLHNGQH